MIMPKIEVTTCDVCGQPARDTLHYGYLCNLHELLADKAYLEKEIKEKSAWFNETWLLPLQEQLDKVNTELNANSN